MILAFDFAGIGILIGAISTAIVGIGTFIRTGRIQHEVRTMNELTIGQLGEAAETRRIEQIPTDERTPREGRHIAMKDGGQLPPS